MDPYLFLAIAERTLLEAMVAARRRGDVKRVFELIRVLSPGVLEDAQAKYEARVKRRGY